MKNTFKTISTKKVNKLLSAYQAPNNPDYWRRVFIDGNGYCYFINGIQITRVSSYRLDFSDPALDYVFIDDMPENKRPGGMIDFFNTTLENLADNGSVFTVDRTNLKNQLAYIKKEYKKGYHGIISKQSPFSIKFGTKNEENKTLVDVKNILELMYLHPDRDITCVTDSNPLKPIVVGNENDEIISILMPLRCADIEKMISIDEV